MSNKDHDYKGVYFTLGPIYFHQFNSFIKHGVGAMKLFQYIKTKQDLTKKSWVKVDNVRKYGASPQIKIICPRKKIN